VRAAVRYVIPVAGAPVPLGQEVGQGRPAVPVHPFAQPVVKPYLESGGGRDRLGRLPGPPLRTAVDGDQAYPAQPPRRPRGLVVAERGQFRVARAGLLLRVLHQVYERHKWTVCGRIRWRAALFRACLQDARRRRTCVSLGRGPQRTGER
jgi:hypothetical protein